MPAYLTLENGMVFEGEFFGAEGDVTGEVVFNTAMNGYLETLTDQSYNGQIVLQTFPLIGGYGVIPADFLSDSVGVAAYIVKSCCPNPSNFRSEGDLGTFLKSRGVVGLSGIDTRALTKVLRENGTMNGRISAEKSDNLDSVKAYKLKNAVESASSKESVLHKADNAKFTVAMLDFGAKENIGDLLALGCDVWSVPHTTTAAELIKLKPDGVIFSNGPGDPADNTQIVENITEILKLGIPAFGIGLGHQLLAMANGFKTYKLKYGHRGANQPVKDTRNGQIYITSQNHGYAVDTSDINPAIAETWLVNVNDKTNEGLIYSQFAGFSTQFSPNRQLLKDFVDVMEEHICRESMI